MKIDKSKIKKILVIRLDKIGDLICSVPFLKLLKNNFPEARLVIMATFYTQEILKAYDFIDEVIIYDFRFSPKDKKEFIKNLQSRKFDLSIALSPLSLAYWLVYKTKSPYRAGWVYSRRWLVNILTKKWLNIRLISHIDDLLKKNKRIPHEIEQTIELAKFMGLEATEYPELYLPLKKDFLKFDFKFLDKDKFLGLHLSYKWLSNNFKIPDFYEFINKTLKHWDNFKLIITSGPQEKDLVNSLKKSFSRNQDRVFIFDNLNLFEWAYLISQCLLFFTPDTGATHLAAALKVSVVCIFEDKKFLKCSQQWYPWGVNYLALEQSQLKELTKEDFENMNELIKDVKIAT